MKKNYKTKKEEMENGKIAGNAVVFENPEFGKIRTLTDENGEPLFCAKDVCDVLGYKKSRNAVNQLVNPLDALKQGAWVVTGIKKDGTDAKRFQQMIYVSESGFYALVLGSKLPTAVKFKNWVTADVLPQIRKTGGYIPVQQGESDEETIRHAEEILRATLKEKENLLKKQRLQIEQQKKLIGEQDTEIRRLNDVVDEQVVRNAKNGENIIQLENQFQMGISPEVAEGTYSNLALITHSSSDFILDFACALPGMPAPQIKNRVIMAPEHAKRLLQALQSNIYNYEQSFGKIKLSDEQERTIAPFGTPKGEA